MTCKIPILFEIDNEDQIVNSPILDIIEPTMNSMFAVAPEKANETLDLICTHGVKFSLDNRGRFIFSVKTESSGSTVKASLQGLEFLWVTSYAYSVIYQASMLPENQEKGGLCLSDYPDTRTAAKLLQWIVNKEKFKTPNSPWPSGCPQPQPLPESPDPSNPNATWVASELFLCAVGWIFHHELAHVKLRHQGVSVYSQEEEMKADNVATKTLLQGITDKDTIRKRGLGITIALLTLSCLDLETKVVQISNIPRSHPNIAKRLFHALDHTALDLPEFHKFVAYILKLHFDHLGIELPQIGYLDARTCLGDYLYKLRNHTRHV